MFFVRRHIDVKAISTIRSYSLSRRNHYDVLNLRRNCTDKQIKEAFIRMSKEFHPDKNKDVKAQENFVHIVEAYNVLGKPGSRAQYDSMIELQNRHGGTSYVYRTHVPYNLRKNPQYSYYQETQRTAQSAKEAPKSYYGVKGINKLPNSVVIIMCFGMALFGVVVQMFVIRQSFTQRQRQADETTQYLAEELDKVKEAAIHNGNELQTRLVLDKIVNASSTTVATASLGQTLAREDKTPVDSEVTEYGILEESDNWSHYTPLSSNMKAHTMNSRLQSW